MRTIHPSVPIRRSAPIVALIASMGLLSIVGVLSCWFVGRAELPEAMATHWGLTGRPDGFMRPLVNVLESVIMPAVLTALFGAMAVAVRGQARTAMVLTTALLPSLATLMGSEFLRQRGVQDPASLGGPTVGLIAGAVVGALCATVMWPLVRRLAPATERCAGVRPLSPILPGHDAVWVGRTSSSRPVGYVVILILALEAAVTAALLAQAGAQLWLVLGVPLLTATVWATLRPLHIVVNDRGVRLYLAGVLRVAHIPLRDISAAEVRPVAALREFGGWGFRANETARGVVTASGPAVFLRRPSRPDYVLTVEAADDTAGTINALLAAADSRHDTDRAEPRHPGSAE